MSAIENRFTSDHTSPRVSFRFPSMMSAPYDQLLVPPSPAQDEPSGPMFAKMTPICLILSSARETFSAR